MNVYTTENDPYDYGGSRMSPPAPSPNRKNLVEGYRKDILSGFEKEHPRLNPLNTNRPQSSMLVDLNDPIQVHLLTETALSDSKKYEILSQEEVDDLKRQVQSLSQRVESTRANLMIQSKYRDAAISMAKLYSTGRPEGRRRSLLSRHSGDQESAREAELEMQASQRKCEELAAELYNLEKRLMEPQRRLLEHTAGILQLTHKASKRKRNQVTPPGQLINGMPGSPESLYTYTRDSIDAASEGNYFDDSGMDRFDQLDGMALQTRELPRANPLEIPVKSPIREQTNQLREEMDRFKDENNQLRHQMDDLVNSISQTETRLEALNGSLKEAIVRFDPSKNSEYSDPPVRSGHAGKLGDALKVQMDYLETGLFAIQAEQESMGGSKEVDQRIEALNRQVRDILLSVNPEYPAADVSADDSEGQLAYLQDSLRAVDAELSRAISAANVGTAKKQDSDQIEVVLMGLWDIIQSGFASIKQQREERRRARQEKGLAVEEEDMSDDEDFNTDEPYTLTGFSARVQWLYSQATTLRDQKFVLKRQIKQQRILNNKSDAEKDEELQRRQEELEQNRTFLDRAEKDALDAQAMLSDALRDLEEAREAAHAATSAQSELEERNGKIASLQAEIEQLQTNLTTAEDEVKHLRSNLVGTGTTTQELQSKLFAAENRCEELQSELATAQSETQQLQANLEAAESGSKSSQGKVAEVEATIASLKQQLDDATKSRTAADENATTLKDLVESQKDALAQKEKALKAKEDELEELNMTMVEMKTELTIAQAELDGAYGTRAERAAEVAAIKQSAEVVKLQNQIDRLKKELGATVKELEDITKETIGAEREKLELEAKLDEALGARSGFEGEITALRERLDGELQKSRDKIAKLQEELDGERLKAGPGQGGAGRAGASMLSEQFRATMREERKKFQEDMKEERARNRKLEEEIARLKRAAGPGKSPLSPRHPPPS